jgi:restriction endonuclease S subunit
MTHAHGDNRPHRAPPPPGWQRVPLGKVGEIVSGVTLGRRLGGSRARRVPYLRVANVRDAHLDLSDVYEIEASEEEIEKLRLRVGDLLLTEGGDADKLGRGTLWRGELPLCIHQNHIFRVRFDPEQFAPEFIAAQVASPYGKAYFLAHAKQTTGIATINQRMLAAFPLIAPPFTNNSGSRPSCANRWPLWSRREPLLWLASKPLRPWLPLTSTKRSMARKVGIGRKSRSESCWFLR